MLPGHIFTDPYKENFHKTQQFELVNNVPTSKTAPIREDQDQYLLDSMTKAKFDLTLASNQRKAAGNDYIPRIQSPWLKYDRQVLRFYAYFQEHVVESSL
jgi:hypothetical protein